MFLTENTKSEYNKWYNKKSTIHKWFTIRNLENRPYALLGVGCGFEPTQPILRAQNERLQSERFPEDEPPIR
jgi:hypothetical protein